MVNHGRMLSDETLAWRLPRRYASPGAVATNQGMLTAIQ